jgi:hypothetical protein
VAGRAAAGPGDAPGGAPGGARPEGGTDLIAFSVALKDELARIWADRACCLGAELSGLARTAGTVAADDAGGLTLRLRTNHATVARKAYRLAREVLGSRVTISSQRRVKLDKATFFYVQSSGPQLSAALLAVGIAEQNGEPLPAGKLAACCRSAFLRGAFLGAGFMADPRRGYHWEIVFGEPAAARGARDLLRAEGIRAGLIRRRHEHVVYLKEAEGIALWLSRVGAHQALLSLENTRIYKEMKNRVNRLVNCDTANLSRAIEAGLEQQRDIRAIEETLGLGALPPNLQEVARLRAEHPEATLEELGGMLSRPLGKSGVNHRLRQLRRIARSARNAADGN